MDARTLQFTVVTTRVCTCLYAGKCFACKTELNIVCCCAGAVALTSADDPYFVTKYNATLW